MKQTGELLCSQNAHGETVLVQYARWHPHSLFHKRDVL